MLFPNDPQFSQSFAQSRLGPIHNRLLGCVTQAWDTLGQIGQVADEVGPALSYKGTRAYLMNALVVENVRREFPQNHDSGYEPVDGNGFLELQVPLPSDNVRIDLRFKMCGSDGATMNLDTPAQKVYRNQLPFTGIGDADKVLRLSVSWRWDAAAADLDDVRVTYLKGYEPEWSYSILRDAGEGTADITPMPTPAVPPASGTKYRKAIEHKEIGRKKGTA